jgi:hypothetical protein
VSVLNDAGPVLVPGSRESLTILKAGTITDMGRTQLSWAAPTTVTTVNGSLQPAGTSLLERAGLLGREGVYQVSTDTPVSLAPSTNRLQVNARTYEVLQVEEWNSHTEALVREVS